MNIGMDGGRSAFKVVNSKHREYFESFCGEGRILDFDNNDERYRVMINGKEYFVGEMAKREGMSRAYEKEKNERLLPLVAAGVALMEPTGCVNLIFGTPISDHKAQKQNIENFIKGSYTVILKNKVYDFSINQAKVFPEGLGAFYSLALNNQGMVTNMDLAQGTVGIIDIGYKTTDVCLVDKMQFQDKDSLSLPLGMVEAYNLIYKRMAREEDLMPEEIEDTKDAPEYELLAQQIQDKVNRLWGKRVKVFLTGGGSYLLSKYFPGVPVIKDAEYANAVGFYKIAQMVYGEEVVRWNFPT